MLCSPVGSKALYRFIMTEYMPQAHASSRVFPLAHKSQSASVSRISLAPAISSDSSTR